MDSRLRGNDGGRTENIEEVIESMILIIVQTAFVEKLESGDYN